MSASTERLVNYRVQLNSGDYHAYAEEYVEVGEEMETFAMDFVMTEPTDSAPTFCLNLGKFPDEEIGEHELKIDNVRLCLVDDSDVEYGEEEVEKAIAINQVGYKKNDKKIAVFKGEEVGDSFQVIACESGEVVYEGAIYGRRYNAATRETNSLGDFSQVTKPGTYEIVIKDGEAENKSYTFKVGDEVYKDLFKDSLNFFYLQRCGGSIDTQSGGAWAHPECHTELARIYGTDEWIDVSGGWHDAGDYGRYIVATATTLADLVYAYEANPEVFDEATDFKGEMRYQLEWFLKMQDEKTGGVYHKVTCAGFPGYIMPEEEKDELIVSPISTTATGDFAAIMAMGYEHFKESDPAFAQSCLEAGEKAWAYLEETPTSGFTNPEGIVTGEYGDPEDNDERYWAAAQLYRATGDEKYNQAFNEQVANGIRTGYGWEHVGSFGNTADRTAE